MDCMQRLSNVLLYQLALTIEHIQVQVLPALQLAPACNNLRSLHHMQDL